MRITCGDTAPDRYRLAEKATSYRSPVFEADIDGVAGGVCFFIRDLNALAGVGVAVAHQHEGIGSGIIFQLYRAIRIGVIHTVA
ncbi:hypothetical protein SDC9_48097 [bioreactor metagenome]|uniref:Uncharacterized protein n=1 Tax=bioreactor metagenome TaxID=1076179 RepID=A0A644WE97_9ZZZZ